MRVVADTATRSSQQFGGGGVRRPAQQTRRFGEHRTRARVNRDPRLRVYLPTAVMTGRRWVEGREPEMWSGRRGAAVIAFAAAVGASASGCAGAGSGQDGSSADRVAVVGTGAGGSPVPTASNPQGSLGPAATGSAGSPSATPDSAGSRVPVCAEIATWGTSLQESAPYTGAELYGVRAGRHDCYDRVVFDINAADTVGYHVRYVDSVHADGSGEPVPVAGDAALEVIVHAPDFGSASSGHQPWRDLWKVGQTLLDPRGWQALDAMKFAGSFEGQTTFAVGVEARAPFRVHTLPDNAVTHVVLDIAHGQG